MQARQGGGGRWATSKAGGRGVSLVAGSGSEAGSDSGDYLPRGEGGMGVIMWASADSQASRPWQVQTT